MRLQPQAYDGVSRTQPLPKYAGNFAQLKNLITSHYRRGSRFRRYRMQSFFLPGLHLLAKEIADWFEIVQALPNEHGHGVHDGQL